MPVLTKEYLESKLVPDLKKIAKKIGIKNYSKLNKKDLIKIISNNEFNKSQELEMSPKAKSPKAKSPKAKSPKAKSPKAKTDGILDKIKEFFSPSKKVSKPKKLKKPILIEELNPVAKPKKQVSKKVSKPKKLKKPILIEELNPVERKRASGIILPKTRRLATSRQKQRSKGNLDIDLSEKRRASILKIPSLRESIEKKDVMENIENIYVPRKKKLSTVY